MAKQDIISIAGLEQRTIAPIGIPLGTTLIALCNSANPVTAAK